MRKLRNSAIACLFAATVAVYGQGSKAAAGDAAKGKAVFDQQCQLCHDALSTDKKMGPGLKGLVQEAQTRHHRQARERCQRARSVNTGGNGMPPYKDMMSDADKADLLAYLKTL